MPKPKNLVDLELSSAEDDLNAAMADGNPKWEDLNGIHGGYLLFLLIRRVANLESRLKEAGLL